MPENQDWMFVALEQKRIDQSKPYDWMFVALEQKRIDQSKPYDAKSC